jgi:hypothetical protein
MTQDILDLTRLKRAIKLRISLWLSLRERKRLRVAGWVRRKR